MFVCAMNKIKHKDNIDVDLAMASCYAGKGGVNSRFFWLQTSRLSLATFGKIDEYRRAVNVIPATVSYGIMNYFCVCLILCFLTQYNPVISCVGSVAAVCFCGSNSKFENEQFGP